MQGFQDVELTWKGAEYTLKAKGIMPVVAEIEEALRGQSGKPALQVLLQSGGPSFPKLAMAFGIALRAAGAAVTDEEIYLSIVDDFAQGKSDVSVVVQSAVMAILAIIAPPVALAMSGGDDEPGEA